EGAAEVEALVDGPVGAVEVTGTVRLAEGQVLDRPVENLRLSIDGVLRSASRLTAQITGTGALDAEPLSLSAEMDMAGEALGLRALDLTLAGTRATGGVVRGLDGLLAGDLEIESTNLSPLAALALVEAQGAGDITLRLRRQEGGQGVSLVGALQNVAAFDQSIEALD
ncbi:MAG: hypothetical protein AAFR93_17985, partial [Pseudomonadota bacterium]